MRVEPLVATRQSGEARPAAAPTLKHEAPTETARAVASVLVVDDDGNCRSGLRRHLVQAGFEVCEAANGLEALHVLNRRHVDVLVTDVRMPTMNGLALADAVAEDHPRLPVIVYSGAHLIDPALNARLTADHAQFLQKPFAPEELVAALHRAMRTG